MVSASHDNGMATPHVQPVDGAGERGRDGNDDDDESRPMAALSDYGSDIDVDWNDDSMFAVALETATATRPTLLSSSITFDSKTGAHYGHGVVQVAHQVQSSQSGPASERQAVEVEYHEGSRRRWSGTVSNETPAPQTDG